MGFFQVFDLSSIKRGIFQEMLPAERGQKLQIKWSRMSSENFQPYI